MIIALIFFYLLNYKSYYCHFMNYRLWEYGTRHCIFLLMACHVELGLLVCFIRNPPSRVHSGRNIVRMQLFPGYTYGLLPLPFILVNFSDHLGFSDVCGQIPTEVRMVVGSLKRPLFIYWKSLLHFVKWESFSKAALECSIRSLHCVETRIFPYLLLLITHNYQQLNMCCLQQVPLCLFLLLSALPLV